MTFQQLRLVVETYECGSISAAADKLHISQPNASMSIKKLEEELGYQLFHRNGNGISLTEQGYRFLEHAEALLEEDRAIRAINVGEGISRLRVGVTSMNFPVDAFLRFCNEKKGLPAEDYTCLNISQENGIRLLAERKLDVIVTGEMKELLPIAEKVCRENRFTLHKHADLPLCVRVRKDHPLVLNGTLDGSLKGFKQLSAYPYAEYVNLERITNMYFDNSQIPFGCSGKIRVDERDTRYRVLQETDAYSIGYVIPPEKMEKYGIVSFPTNTAAVLLSYIRKGDENIKDVARYLELLNEETAKI